MHSSQRGVPFGAAAPLIAAIWVMAVVVMSGPANTFDRTIHDVVVAARTPTLTQVAALVTSLGSWPVLVTVAALAAAIMGFRTRRVDRPIRMALGLATIVLTTYVLKIAIARPRPPVATMIGSPPSDFSIPSGHTADGSVTWVLAALLLTAGLRAAVRRTAFVAAVLLAAAIGLSRVYLGYHWMTDVITGWLLAMAVIWVSVGLHRDQSVAAHGAADRSADVTAPARSRADTEAT